MSYYHPLARRFGILRHDPVRNSLGDNTVSCIVEDPSSESLWIGTNDDGVNLYDRRTGVSSELNTANGALLSNNVKCVLPDGRGRVDRHHAGGLSSMDVATRRTRHYPVNASIPINNSCYSLLDGGDGTLWVGTQRPAVVRHRRRDASRATSAPITNPNWGRCRSRRFPRLEGPRWIGTGAGLYLWQPGVKQVMACELTLAKNGISPLRQDVPVMCVAEDTHRNIWIGTRQGLAATTPRTIRSPRFTVADGLPNDFVYGILEDELARLWISTNNGLACFDTQKNTFRRYSLCDGIANNQFNIYSYCRSRDGVFWFGGIGGITWFRPHDLVDNPFAPAPQITGVDVADSDGDRRVRIERDSAGARRRGGVPLGGNIFTVRFLAVNPLAGGRNTFAYKLRRIPTPAGTKRRTRSQLLEPQARALPLQVRAANNDGRWNDEPATVEIRVLPMWWTLAAKILWVLLALGFVGASWRRCWDVSR